MYTLLYEKNVGCNKVRLSGSIRLLLLGLSLSTFSIFLFKPKTNRNFSDLSEKWGEKLECITKA